MGATVVTLLTLSPDVDITSMTQPTCGSGNRSPLILIADAKSNCIQAFNDSRSSLQVFSGACDQAQENYTDGTLDTARYARPQSLVEDCAGNVFVSDPGNAVIRLIRPAANLVSTFAGVPGQSGYRDGPVDVAKFNSPWTVHLDHARCPARLQLLIYDKGNSKLRSIDVDVSGCCTAPGPIVTPPPASPMPPASAGSPVSPEWLRLACIVASAFACICLCIIGSKCCRSPVFVICSEWRRVNRAEYAELESDALCLPEHLQSDFDPWIAVQSFNDAQAESRSHKIGHSVKDLVISLIHNQEDLDRKKPAFLAVQKALLSGHNKCFGWKVKDVVIAGSFGQGTASRHTSDIDVIVLYAGFQVSHYASCLEHAKALIRKNIDVQDTRSKAHHYEFKFQDVSFDILVAGTKTNGYPECFRPENDSVHNYRLRPTFYRHTLHFARSLATRYPTFVNTVLLAKDWRDSEETWSGKKPSSWLLSLLIGHTLQIADRGSVEPGSVEPASQSVYSTFMAFLVLISDTTSTTHRSALRIIWPTNYDESDISPELYAKRPLIMDPVDKTNNVADELNEAEWASFIAKAKETATRMHGINESASPAPPAAALAFGP